MSVDLDAHTQAVVDHLDAAGLLVGRGTAPDGAGWPGSPGQSQFAPYVIVWRIGASDLSAPFLDGDYGEARPLFHIRTVGGTPTEADATLDAVNAAMLGQTIVVAGRRVWRVVYDTSITTTRDTDVHPPVYYTGVYYRLITEAA